MPFKKAKCPCVLSHKITIPLPQDHCFNVRVNDKTLKENKTMSTYNLTSVINQIINILQDNFMTDLKSPKHQKEMLVP